MKYRTCIDKLIVYWRLGLYNLLKVAIYRFQVKSGWFIKSLPVGPFISQNWQMPSSDLQLFDLKRDYRKALASDRYHYFFYHEKSISSPPNWFYNPFTGHRWLAQAGGHWSRVSYFPAPGEDIKVIWELSRFYWMPYLAIAYRASQERQYLEQLHAWLNDWCDKNPINTGVNWLCAQEAGVRLCNFILSQLILNIKPGASEIAFCEAHAKRIIKTLHYADAQCNNHATSEAVALYVVGTWLLKHSASRSKEAKLWQAVGQKHLEKLAKKLILPDGTFSQYSVTYHRMMLDALSLAVHFQQNFQGKVFSNKFMHQYRLAYNWLLAMVDPISGDAPNLGANDGTLFFKLDSCDYRDFRPSLQLASVLLDRKRIYEAGPWDEVLAVLGLEYKALPVCSPILTPREFVSGGYVRLQGDGHWVLLNYPRYKYRPSQCDAMHFDLWVDGRNVLIDSGTYSYNPKPGVADKLINVEGHNTVQFDHHDQMPKLSRFLYGRWLKIKILDRFNEHRWSGRYRNASGATHTRTIYLEGKQYKIVDELDGFKENAVIRWHVPCGEWLYQDDAWRGQDIVLKMLVDGKSAMPFKKLAEISRYYLAKEPCIVFELEVTTAPATIVTLITLR